MKLMKATRKGEEKRKTFMEKYFAGARENKEAIKYVALFLVFCAAFFFVYHFLTVSGSMIMVHVRNITALILGTILSLSGMDVVVDGTLLSV